MNICYWSIVCFQFCLSSSSRSVSFQKRLAFYPRNWKSLKFCHVLSSLAAWIIVPSHWITLISTQLLHIFIPYSTSFSRRPVVGSSYWIENPLYALYWHFQKGLTVVVECRCMEYGQCTTICIGYIAIVLSLVIFVRIYQTRTKGNHVCPSSIQTRE